MRPAHRFVQPFLINMGPRHLNGEQAAAGSRLVPTSVYKMNLAPVLMKMLLNYSILLTRQV